MACIDTLVYPNAYQGIIGGILRGICFLRQVTKIYSLKYIELVPNLANNACGGTVVYPGGF